MGLGGVISSLLSLGANLLPLVNESAQNPGSSSSSPVDGHQMEAKFEKLTRTLERMKAALYDAEEKEIDNCSVKPWLKELKQVTYDAENALDEYHYEVLRAQVEARDATSRPDSRKRKLIQMPSCMSDRIKHIKDKLDEMGKHSIALWLSDDDELKEIMRMLERIKVTLYDAEGREIIECRVKHWLKELKQVAYYAEDVLDEYTYEVMRIQVEARDSSLPDSHKGKLIQMPNGMLDRIKIIKGRYDEIEKARIALQITEEDGLRRHYSEFQVAPSGPFVVESEIIGREREKEELVDLLSTECNDGEIVSVVAIVGTRGLGKTTLAQLTYNDHRVKQNFDIMVWIFVSEDFNVERLMRASVESITGCKCDLTDVTALQNDLSEKVRGQRVLLVLDDVWNELRPPWESFQAAFMSAAVTKFLVTTRNKSVAEIMQTLPSFELGYLSEEQCWELFKKYAFGDVNQDEGSNFVLIGKNILEKCGSLPLAIKSIGSLLMADKEEKNWKEILDSELWESEASKEIFPPLQISYQRLPPYLKPCFLYCCMFPKGYQFNSEWLAQLWIFQDYIQSNSKKNVEEIGLSYVKQLWQRSFFEGECGGKQFHLAKFKLHDMVHDLARLNSQNECHSIESDWVPSSSNELRHLSVGNFVKILKPLPSGMFASLRTLIIGGLRGNYFGAFDIKTAQSLRALELGSRVSDLESLFSGVVLKHLRYLAIRNWHHEWLPECMCSLYNLQNLTLSNYHHIKELPKSIGNLVSLKEKHRKSC